MARVLIVDDDPLFCEMFCDAMQLHGHEAGSACTLHEGRERIAVAKPEVVFLDVRLPDGNGLDLVTDIVALADGPEVVVITAAGDPAAAEQAITSGAWDYIQKPASIETMWPSTGPCAIAGVALPPMAGFPTCRVSWARVRVSNTASPCSGKLQHRRRPYC